MAYGLGMRAEELVVLVKRVLAESDASEDWVGLPSLEPGRPEALYIRYGYSLHEIF